MAKPNAAALAPVIPLLENFNAKSQLPLGLEPGHVHAGMVDFCKFLSFINAALVAQGIERLETMLMPANFSSIVGEFMGAAIPKHCKSLVKNAYHNGHPDLIPAGVHPKDAIQHHHVGIEVKGSRYLKGWQGHNAEDTWLMVFVFDSNRPVDESTGVAPVPFRFVLVCGAPLVKSDWTIAGRSATSRRTPTATVKKSGYEKMRANWIYRAPSQ